MSKSVDEKEMYGEGSLEKRGRRLRKRLRRNFLEEKVIWSN